MPKVRSVLGYISRCMRAIHQLIEDKLVVSSFHIPRASHTFKNQLNYGYVIKRSYLLPRSPLFILHHNPLLNSMRRFFKRLGKPKKEESPSPISSDVPILDEKSWVSPMYSWLLSYVFSALVNLNAQQVQHSASGLFANSQNILITGGTFVSKPFL